MSTYRLISRPSLINLRLKKIYIHIYIEREREERPSRATGAMGGVMVYTVGGIREP